MRRRAWQQRPAGGAARRQGSPRRLLLLAPALLLVLVGLVVGVSRSDTPAEVDGSAQAPPDTPAAAVTGAARFGQLDALVGRWQGYIVPADGSPHGVAERTYRYVLRGMFLECRSTMIVPPAVARTDFDFDHELELISRDVSGERFLARRFLPQGIVTTETVTIEATAGRAVFESVELLNGAPGTRTRRTLTLEDGERLREVFEIAMPGIGFQTYLTLHLRRIENAR